MYISFPQVIGPPRQKTLFGTLVWGCEKAKWLLRQQSKLTSAQAGRASGERKSRPDSGPSLLCMHAFGTRYNLPLYPRCAGL